MPAKSFDNFVVIVWESLYEDDAYVGLLRLGDVAAALRNVV